MKQLFKKYSKIYPNIDAFSIMYEGGDDNNLLYSHDLAKNARSYLFRRRLETKTELIVSAMKACEKTFKAI